MQSKQNNTKENYTDSNKKNEETAMDNFDKKLVEVLNKKADFQDIDHDVKDLLTKNKESNSEIDDELFFQDFISDPYSLVETEEETVERLYTEVDKHIKIAADRETADISIDHKKDVIRMYRMSRIEQEVKKREKGG